MSQSPRFEKLAGEAASRIREVDAKEASDLQRKGALLVDVREAEEFERGHADGAVHLSRGVLELKIENAAPDVDAPIVCYCGGGKRSALAADSLQKMGYTNVASLAGGFRTWKDAGLPTA